MSKEFSSQHQELFCSEGAADAVSPPSLTPHLRLSSPLLSSPLLSSGLQGCRRFRSSAVDYRTVLLEAESQRLYVGARGAVFALNATDISARSALTVSCLHVTACCAPRLPYPQPSNGIICIPQHRNFLRHQDFIFRQKYLFPHHLRCF